MKSIPSFIDTYNIQLDDLLEPDITKYSCFNDFFYRRLKPDARPVQNVEDPTNACSAADCRLTVFPSVDLAKQLWIKGNNFTIPALLGVEPTSEIAQTFAESSVACFRCVTTSFVYP